MQYYISPQATANHGTVLQARLSGVTSEPYIPADLTIQWRQNGVVVKQGSSNDSFYRSINTSVSGDVLFDSSDTGSIIDFIIDPDGAATPSLYVVLTNNLPTISASLTTDAYSRTSGRPTLSWVYADADGDAQFSYRVRFGSTAGGSDYYDTGTVLSTALTVTIPTSTTAIPEGALYYWTLDVSDGEKVDPLAPDSPSPTRTLVTATGTGRVNTAPVVSAVLIDGEAPASDVENAEPVFSWTYSDVDSQPQQYYRVIVATDAGLTQVLWDSGFVAGTETSAKYNFNLTGEAIDSHTTLYVSVQAKDTFGVSNQTSDTFSISNKPIITTVTVDNKVNPRNVRTNAPYFNWIYVDADNDPLTGFDIRVSDSDADLGTDSFVGNIWHPGPRITPEAYKVQFNDDGTAFPGCPALTELQAGTRYYFQVQVYDAYDTSDWASGFFVLNTPPTASGLTIIPAAPYTSDDLEATYEFSDSVGDFESEKTQIRWYKKAVGESTFSEVTSVRNKKTVPSALTSPGEQWKFTVRPHDGIDYSTLTYTSSAVTILNRAPTASALVLLPSSPTTSDDLKAIFAASDPDDDTVTVTIRWYKNGSEVVALKNSLVIPASVTSLDDEWYFTVLPNDGYENGPLAISSTVTISNTPPKITSFSVEGKVLPKSVKSANPSFAWGYFDDDSQDQEKFQFMVGTRPVRTRKVLGDLFSRALSDSSSAIGTLLRCNGDDGIVSTADGDGEVVAGDEIFDSGIVSSSQTTYQYVTPDFMIASSMPAVSFSFLNGYALSSDLQTIMLQTGSAEGSASGKFVGQSAIYDIELTYLKEDGRRATYKLIVDGVLIGQFTSQPGTGPATHIFNAVKVDSGAVVGVSGAATDTGSRARFRQLALQPVSRLAIKAGDFRTLSGYLQDGNGGIKLAGLAGTASTKFEFPSGVYDIEVVYITETFGNPSLMLSVNSTSILSFTYESEAKTRSKFVSGVTLTKGDTIKISGTRNAGAPARVKEVIFKPTQTVNVGAKLKDGLTYFASVRVFDGREWSEWFTTKFAMAGSAWLSDVSNARGWTIETRMSVAAGKAETLANKIQKVLGTE